MKRSITENIKWSIFRERYLLEELECSRLLGRNYEPLIDNRKTREKEKKLKVKDERRWQEIYVLEQLI